MIRALAWLALLTGCAPAPVVDPTDDPTTVDTDGDSPPVETDTDAPPAEDTAPPPGAGFTDGRYKATSLRIAGSEVGLDLDGDGTPDNALPALLPLVDAALDWDLSLVAVNGRLDAMLAEERVILLVEVTHAERVVTLGIAEGARGADDVLAPLPAAVDAQGHPLQRLTGAFATVDTFEAGPGALTVPVQLEHEGPIVRLSSTAAWVRSSVDADGFDALIATAISVEDVMTDLVEPLVLGAVAPADQERVLAVARGFVELAADVEVDGAPAVSAAFRLLGEDAAW